MLKRAILSISATLIFFSSVGFAHAQQLDPIIYYPTMPLMLNPITDPILLELDPIVEEEIPVEPLAEPLPETEVPAEPQPNPNEPEQPTEPDYTEPKYTEPIETASEPEPENTATETSPETEPTLPIPTFPLEDTIFLPEYTNVSETPIRTIAIPAPPLEQIDPVEPTNEQECPTPQTSHCPFPQDLVNQKVSQITSQQLNTMWFLFGGSFIAFTLWAISFVIINGASIKRPE